MSDSDDDLPIIDFIQKRKRKEIGEDGDKKIDSGRKSAVSSTSVRSNVVKSEPQEKNQIDRKPVVSSSSNVSADFYENSLKGVLVQKLLVRWWYAIEWPKQEDIAPCPTGFEALDGFPGVFISTKVSYLFIILIVAYS